MIPLAIFLTLALIVVALKAVTGVRIRAGLLDRFGPLLCRVRGRHQRTARRVKRVGDSFRSRCQFCGVALEKPDRDSPWIVSRHQIEPSRAYDRPDEDGAQADGETAVSTD